MAEIARMAWELRSAPNAKEMDTDPGTGFRTQGTTLARVKVEIRKDEASGDKWLKVTMKPES